MPLSWPFSGRTGQIGTIESWIADPDVAGVVVSGPAGVGKSRTVREALRAANGGLEARWVVAARSARDLPLGAFSGWIPQGVKDTVHMIRGVIESLTSTRPGTAVVIAVDDAHLLDELSIFVVHQLVQRHVATVVLTVRDGEPAPTSLHEVLQLGRFERVGLPPLSAPETATLLEATLTGAVDSDAVRRLWQLTGGNLLYLQHIVEHEVTSGRLANDAGVWRWTGDPVLPPDLVGAVESRLGSLPQPVADVMDVLAVAEPMDLAVLTRISGPAAVEAAELGGLITVESIGGRTRVRMSHPLYGEVRRHRTARTRLRRLRGVVATELGRADHLDDIQSVVQRGALTLESDLDPDVNLLMEAAHGAVWLADLGLAERLAQAAAESGGPAEAKLIRAHALSWSGRGEDAEALLSDAAAGQHEDAVRARIAFLRASNLLWALGDPERARQVIDDAAGLASDAARRYVEAFRTISWFAADQPDQAQESAKSLRLQDLPPVVGAEVAWVLATIAADAGRAEDAVAISTTGYAVAQRSLDAPHMRLNIADAQVSAFLLAGQVKEALQTADSAQLQALDLPGVAQLLAAAVAGRAMLGAGQLGGAVALLSNAVQGLCAAHASGWGYRYRIALATALAMRGDHVAAAAELAVIDQTLRPFRSLAYERRLAEAWTAACEGAVSVAIDHALSGAEEAARLGQLAGEVLCRQTATQFGDRTGQARLSELALIVGSPRAHTAAHFAAALQSGNGPELRSVAAEFEQLGDLVAAIDALSLAAVAFRRHDLRGSALACSTEAAALAQRCDGALTPALRQATEPLPLTERERELVMLIGQGLSNREAAEKLTLSVRTVESHIYRAMAKTGTASRAELAALLTLRTDSGS